MLRHPTNMDSPYSSTRGWVFSSKTLEYSRVYLRVLEITRVFTSIHTRVLSEHLSTCIHGYSSLFVRLESLHSGVDESTCKTCPLMGLSHCRTYHTLLLNESSYSSSSRTQVLALFVLEPRQDSSTRDHTNYLLGLRTGHLEFFFVWFTLFFLRLPLAGGFHPGAHVETRKYWIVPGYSCGFGGRWWREEAGSDGGGCRRTECVDGGGMEE